MSIFKTTCPDCGGDAYTNDDDGITYCDDYGPNGCHAKAKREGKDGLGVGMNCEYDYFKPSNYRGG